MTTKERPIIFGAESIRAILDGRKTQTRRVVKPQPAWNAELEMWTWPNVLNGYASCYPTDGLADWLIEHHPYPIGSRWWVREKWRPVYMTPRTRTEELSVVQYADGSFNRDDWGGCKVGETWRSPIFMPRRFSRITLEVTGVRVERLQDITYDDILAEGWNPRTSQPMTDGSAGDDARAWYMALWDSINGKRYPWDSNPWVWVVELGRIL